MQEATPERHKRFGVSFRPTKTFFTMILVVTCVVLIWRGIWNLLDLYFLKGHPVLSNVIGIFVGVLILYLPDRDIKDLL